MMNLIINPEYGLYEKGGKAFCSSRQVADTFKKRHDHIIRDIREKILPNVSAEFGAPNFGETSYRDQWNRRQPEFLMTKDGFTMLALGFSGRKAMAFKEAYIRRFNEMESFIKSLISAKEEFPAFTNAVLMAYDEPKHYHFSNEINMIYRIVIGMDAKAVREERGIPKGASIRPYLNSYEIKAIEELQRADIGLLVSVSDYGERKNILQEYFGRLILRERLTA